MFSREKLFKGLQLAMLFPSILSLGAIGLFLGLGGFSAFIGGFIVHKQEFGWAYLVTTIFGILLYSIMFLIPGFAFVFLWALIIRGEGWFIQRPQLAKVSLAVGWIACVVGLYFTIGMAQDFTDRSAAALIWLFFAPVIIGAMNFISLSKALSKSRK